MSLKLLKIQKANDGVKKYKATFTKDGRTFSVKFGAVGYTDYTLSKDPERKQRYLDRHKANEDWNKPETAGALSRWILWNKLTVRESIADYQARFNL